MMANLGKSQKKSKMKQHLSEKFSCSGLTLRCFDHFSHPPQLSSFLLFGFSRMLTCPHFPEIFSVVFFHLRECLAKSQVHDPFSNWTCDRGLVFSHESSSFLFAYQFRSHFSF